MDVGLDLVPDIRYVLYRHICLLSTDYGCKAKDKETSNMSVMCQSLIVGADNIYCD